MNDSVTVLPGNLLSIAEASIHTAVCQISVEMLPLQHSQHVINVADNFGSGWLDAQNKQLRLQFQLVAVFRNAKAEKLWLSILGEPNKILLTPSCVESPVISQNFPEIMWSGQSRFVVNELIDLPEWAMRTSQFELIADVAGKPEKIAVIHIGDISNRHEEPGSKSVVSPAAAVSSIEVATSSATLATVEPTDREVVVISDSAPVFIKEISRRVKGVNRLLLLTVVLPTLISIIYFGLMASDVYISESRFVVRSPQHQANVGLGALLQGSGFSRSQDDTYTVHDYIFSRDALKNLDEQFAIGKAFASKDVDIFSRFSGLDWDSSFEALHRYYQKHVTVDSDSASSISTLSVSAFTPADAYQINEKLLQLSESLINQLNERGRQDMIRFASTEVATAEQKAKAAALAVSNYRNLKSVFDPEKQSALQLQQVSKLQDELIATKIQLAQIRMLTRDNPQIPSLQKQIETLQSEINSETAKVAGGDRSLANKSTQYEALILERGFAEKQLAAALASLEQARNDAQRKQLYLERVVQPSKPDVAIEPRRIRNIFATFVLGLIAWGILTMLLAGVREHQD